MFSENKIKFRGDYENKRNLRFRRENKSQMGKWKFKWENSLKEKNKLVEKKLGSFIFQMI